MAPGMSATLRGAVPGGGSVEVRSFSTFLCSLVPASGLGREGDKPIAVAFFLLAKINRHGLKIIIKLLRIVVADTPDFLDDGILHE